MRTAQNTKKSPDLRSAGTTTSFCPDDFTRAADEKGWLLSSLQSHALCWHSAGYRPHHLCILRSLCSSCHGENLEGIAELGAPKLIGGRGSLASDKPVKTIESYWPYSSTLFDYVHRAMPLHAPGSLSADEVYAVSAYILGRAGITSDEPDAMLDAESMPKVVMPNADGFIADPRDGSPGK
ncbi:c-type cytochrome [Sulfitobacter faviae]|uniref:c-type cytochrome n=1 Tax=Sulfitobacter faviae TaxID=1775881 RepID=UPI00398CC256